MCPVFQLGEQLLQNFSCTSGLHCRLWGCGFLSESFAQIPVLAKKKLFTEDGKNQYFETKINSYVLYFLLCKL